MKAPVVGSVVMALALTLAGCSGIDVQPVQNYEALRGSGDRVQRGPGLLAGSQADQYNEVGGYLIYSDNPNRKALINPNRKDSLGSSQQAAAPRNATASEQQDFQNYEKFKDMPKDSKEYQEFKEWQEYQQYKQWKQQQAQ